MIKDITLHDKQEQAFNLLTDHKTKYLAFGGGIRGGKSWLGWTWLITQCLQYDNTRWFVGRQELKRLRDSTLNTFFKVCATYSIPDQYYSYNQRDSYIEFANGSRINLLELKSKPSDPLFERFGSTEYTSGWIEEAGEIELDAFDVLKTRVGQHRNDQCGLNPGKILITCNPAKNWLYHVFYLRDKKGVLPEDYAFIQSLYDENPFLESGTEGNLANITSEAQRERLKEGNWDYADDPDALLSHQDLLELNTVSPDKGKHYLGVDVARFGNDSTTFALFKGNTLSKLKTTKGKDTAEVANLLQTFMYTENVVPKKCGIDTVGLGAGVYDSLKEKGKKCTEIVSGESPTNKKKKDSYEFKNLRSQMWWQFRQDVLQKKITLDVNDGELLTDLTAPRYKIVNEKVIQVEAKKDIKKRIGHSPDKGDAVVYGNAMRAGIIKKKRAPVQTALI